MLNHDISLLKLKTEVVFNQYIQPACLWQNKLSDDNIYGTVSIYLFLLLHNPQHLIYVKRYLLATASRVRLIYMIMKLSMGMRCFNTVKSSRLLTVQTQKSCHKIAQ